MTIKGFLENTKRSWTCGVTAGVAALLLVCPLQAKAIQNGSIHDLAVMDVKENEEDILNVGVIDSGVDLGCQWSLDTNGKLTIRSVSSNSNLRNNMWYKYADKIKYVDIDVPYSSHLSYMFSGFEQLEKATIKIDATSGSADDMFACGYNGYSNLTELDVRRLNTSGITSMNYMFYGCYFLESLDLSQWNTSKVSSFSGMFSKCRNLKALNMGGWNTEKVQSMYKMFYECASLRELNLTGFNTSKVTSMYSMFLGCKSMEKLNLTGWDTRNVVSMECMFDDCENLEQLSMAGWSTPNLANMDGMFQNCYSIKGLNLSGLYTGKVKSMNGIFKSCYNLRTLKLDNWDTSQVTSMRDMFRNCESLSYLDLKSFHTENVENMSGMFCDCWLLNNVAIGTFNTSKVTDMSYMFAECRTLKQLDLRVFSTGRVKYMDYMFYNCYTIEDVNLRSFRTPSLLTAYYMFGGCHTLKMIDLSTFDMTKTLDTAKASYYGSYPIFLRCENLMIIKTPKNLQKSYEVPGEGWYRDDKNVLVEWMPQNLSYSIVLHKQEEKNKFVDVRPDGWQYKSVNAVYGKKYMSGKGQTNDENKLVIFDADTPMTRAEFVQTLFNYSGAKGVKYDKIFSDVPKNKWYTNAVLWAYNNKLVTGIGNKKFGVDDKITRQDMVTILYKFAKKTKSSYVSNASKFSLKGFTDYDQVASYATTPLKWATGNKIMSGKPTQKTKLKLVPGGNATRAECAAILNNYISYIAKTK